jgi:hypothetical protein
MSGKRDMAKELQKLPKRKPRGHPDNIDRYIATGFIFMGYSAEQALEKAKAMIKYYDLGGK